MERNEHIYRTRRNQLDRPESELTKGTRDKYWYQAMQGSLKAHYGCIKAYSEPDFTEDLKKIDVPALVMHSEDDEGVPYRLTGARAAKIYSPSFKVSCTTGVLLDIMTAYLSRI
jgi:pimeloyl-ACP methyl ester carboxylesterase